MREYKTGTKWCVWRWKKIYWRGELYLTRLILLQCPLFSVMLHWFSSSDKQKHLHDHPVSMLSIIISGGYYEIRASGEYFYIRKWFNWIPYHTAHKIERVYGKLITLCIAGPHRQEWGFFTKEGKIQWQEYYERYEYDNRRET